MGSRPASSWISIHAPREGSDPISLMMSVSAFRFQSTLPVRGATPKMFETFQRHKISIHAPREGSDHRL